MAQYDIVVIGAGIMGVASAYHLQKNNAGKRILVVDRHSAPGQGNTGRSNAMFRNTFTSSDNQILADSAIDFYTHIQDELKIDIGLEKIGYLWLMDETQLSKSGPYLERMARNRIQTTMHTRDDLKRLLPSLVTNSFEMDEEAKLMNLPPVEGAVFGPKCGKLGPEKLVKFYTDEFAKGGGTFAFNTEALSLVIGPSERLGIEGEPFVWQDFAIEGISVGGSTDGTIQADTVVLAGGAWTNELLEPVGIDGHVKAKKRQLFSVHATGPRLEKLFHTTGFNPHGLIPMVILPKAGVYFRPVSQENNLWVGCEDEVNRPFINLPEHDLGRYSAEREYYEKNISPVLTAYFPEFHEGTMSAMWAGLYAYNTIDNLPFVFRKRNLIVVGGDSGSGIMKGDSLGRVVDALYREQDEALLYGEKAYCVSKLSLDKRDVEREEWVI